MNNDSASDMHIYLQRVQFGIAVICVVMLGINMPMDGSIYSTDFSSNPATDFVPYKSSNAFVWDSLNERLHAERGSLPYEGFYQLTNSSATEQDNVLVQTTFSITIGSPNNDYAVIGGLQARVTSGADNYASGYYAVLGRPSWETKDQVMHLYLGRDIGEITDTAVDMGAILATGDYDASTSEAYTLKFMLNGNSLLAQLWNATGTTLLDEVSASDATYSQGNIGYVSALRSGTTHYYYDNLIVAAVPEPATFCLLAIGSVFVMIRKKR